MAGRNNMSSDMHDPGWDADFVNLACVYCDQNDTGLTITSTTVVDDFAEVNNVTPTTYEVADGTDDEQVISKFRILQNLTIPNFKF